MSMVIKIRISERNDNEVITILDKVVIFQNNYPSSCNKIKISVFETDYG